MRVMVFVKSTADAEKGTDFTDPKMLEMMQAMGKYNDDLQKAGIKIVEMGGLQESSKGKRVAFDGPNRKVSGVTYKNAGELVSGFWIWEVKDMNQAVEWVKKCPNPMPGPSEIEIRPFHEFDEPQ